MPSTDALFTISPRSMDWTVTVPMLIAEPLAVSTLAGRELSVLRGSTTAAAVAMIVTGYFGTQVFDRGSGTFWLWLWWAISMVFFLYLYVALIPAIGASARAMSTDAGRAYTMAATLPLTTFLAYLTVYLILFFAGGWWTTTMQVALSVADVVTKVCFGMLIHKVTELRSAEDVVAGEQTHPETVWVNNEHYSHGGLPAVANLGEMPRTEGAHAATNGRGPAADGGTATLRG